jgi:hypothetical protein
MTMSPQQIPFLYSYTGGMMPETLEVFWIRADGVAEYVTGNSWPQQPPFDEIGHYRAVVSAEDRETLFRFVHEAERELPPDVTDRSLDSGTEFFRSCLDEKIMEAAWSPSRSPAQYQLLSRQVRQLIARTRNAPLSTLQASFVFGKGADQIGLALQNRGREPFIFYDAQQADEKLRIQAHVRPVKVEPGLQSTPPNPLFLAHLKPLSLSNAPNWRPDAGGKISLKPGTTSQIEIDRPELGPFASSILEGLVRVSFWRGTPEGESLLEQGWAMPAPCRVGFAMGAEKTTA